MPTELENIGFQVNTNLDTTEVTGDTDGDTIVIDPNDNEDTVTHYDNLYVPYDITGTPTIDLERNINIETTTTPNTTEWTNVNNRAVDGTWTGRPVVTNDFMTTAYTPATLTYDWLADRTFTTDHITIDPDVLNGTIRNNWTFQMPDGFETAEVNSAQEARDKKDEFKDKSCIKIKGNTLVELLERIEELEELNSKLEKYANEELTEEWDKIMKG